MKLVSGQTTLGTENQRGRGLGLILCDEFVRLHGGKIEVESTVGAGSLFRFMLPKSVNVI
ncbi:MAG: ATP-binding protein [Salinivirgaceae bacterium]|nr:ATP-binding protein [Salinivirgaceae bacterium]